MSTLKQVENSGEVIFQKTVSKLGEKTLSGSDLKFTFCNLEDLTVRPYGNLFSSFNLPITNNQRTSFLTNNTFYNGGRKENAFKNLLLDSNNNFINKIVVAEIPQNQYGELIDGKTIEIRVPIISGGTPINITSYGTYFGYKTTMNNSFSDTNNESSYFGIKPSSNVDGNSNIAYLFSNEISKPKIKTSSTKILVSSYTVNSPININQKIDNTVLFNLEVGKYYSFEVDLGVRLSNLLISATGGAILQTNDDIGNQSKTSVRTSNVKIEGNDIPSIRVRITTVNSYTGPPLTLTVNIYETTVIQDTSWSKWTNSNKFPSQPGVFNGKPYANFTDTNNSGLLIDEPVGIAYLDKGFCVFTHPTIVDNFNFSASTSSGYDNIVSGATYSGDTNFTQVYFNSPSQSYIKYDSITTEFVQSIMAIAMPNEFYISKNPTFEEVYGVNGVNNITNDPVYITEIGLYNEFGELIAIAKTSEPIAKTKANIVSFNIQLKL